MQGRRTAALTQRKRLVRYGTSVEFHFAMDNLFLDTDLSLNFAISKDILTRIQTNDPNVSGLVLDPSHFEVHGLDLGAVSACIGQSTFIKRISMHHFRGIEWSVHGKQKWNAFFEGLSQSQSVDSVEFKDCDLYDGIFRMFTIGNLEKVNFVDCIITYQTTLALRKAARLSRVVIGATDRIGLVFDDDTATPQEFMALLSRIKSLELWGTNIHDLLYRAVGCVLSDQQCTINKLKIDEDEHLVNLQTHLIANSSIEILDLTFGPNLTTGGWRVVSEILKSPHTTLSHLNLDGSSINDDSARVLAAGLARNNALERLNFHRLSYLGADGWLSILSSLCNSSLPLKYIDLSGNHAINDEVASSVAELLVAKRNSIEEFNLRDCFAVTAAGWAYISTALKTPMPNLTKQCFASYSSNRV